MGDRHGLRRALCIGSLCLGMPLATPAAADPPRDNIAPELPAPPLPPPSIDAPDAPVSPPANAIPATAQAADPAPVAPMTAVAAVPADVQVHANGRLAGLLCQGQPLRALRCRYGSATGLVLTYHATGSVAEVLSFRDGFLDGLTEVYDATGHLLERTLYRAGFPVPLAEVRASAAPSDPQLPAPPTVSVPNTPTTAPSSLASTAPTTIDLDGEQPAPPVAGTPGMPTVPSRPRPDRPADLAPVLGLGLRGLLGAMISDVAVPGFAGGQLVFAVSPSGNTHPELAVGATMTFDAKGQYRRLDVPISLGLQVNLTRASAPIYLAMSMDLLYARRSLPGDVPGPRVEEAWLFGGSGGLGIDLPMWVGSRSQGRILTDVRIGGTGRVDSAPPLLLPQETGEPRAAIAGQFRVLLTMTAQVNFGG